MQVIRHALSAATLALLTAPAFAATAVFTDATAFLSQLAVGAYTESFDALADLPAGPVSFAGGAFSYSLAAPSDLYASGAFVGSSQPDEALTISFLGGKVQAVGANFFATNLSDAFQVAAMELTLSDGTVLRFTPGSEADSYRGFVSDVPISTLAISGPGAFRYAGLDNLTVGISAVSPVPEPGRALLLALGLAALAGQVVARRRPA